jgi:hypothetical protein
MWIAGIENGASIAAAANFPPPSQIHQLREGVSGARQILHRVKIVKGQALAMHTEGGNPNRRMSNLRAPGLTATREVDADEASILGLRKLSLKEVVSLGAP